MVSADGGSPRARSTRLLESRRAARSGGPFCAYPEGTLNGQANTPECSSSARARPGSRPPSTRRGPSSHRSSSRACSPAGSSPSPPRSRTSPASRTGSSGPELMDRMRAQAERFGTAAIVRRGDGRGPARHVRSGSTTAEHGDAHLRRADRRHRRLRPATRPARRAGAHGLRRLGVRHLRRLLLQGQGDRGRRRRRHRDGGGDLPDPLRQRR